MQALSDIELEQDRMESRMPVMEIIAPNGTVIKFYEHISIYEIKELIDMFLVEKRLVPAGLNEVLSL
ncbi:hypothetical protein SAMN04487898_12422 [Pedobacter sp. ok626]|uniref:hypothetical protein n=1 Tax=Pedobacter sp. ok626 TaxID=1761882 RepID=UPI00088BF814|nr:hypothetical protein [Pedobacter sp. ok626]SDL75036.1 hypothetical protein SAMN04487898_12422 [Pedobacter sp. ok626]